MSQQAIDQAVRNLEHALFARHRPLTLILDAELRLFQAHGDPDHFGLGPLQPGDDMTRPLPILHGTLDDPEFGPLELPFVDTPSGAVANIHARRLPDGGLVLLLEDASEEHQRLQQQQQLSNELQLLQQRQQRLLQELELANRAKSRFIARMSHEFRTPLTSILGYSELIRESSDDERHHRYLGAVERGGRHLMNLVDNLLDQARLEAGELQISPQPCNPAQLLEEQRELMQPLADRKGLMLQFGGMETLPDTLVLDAMRLRQILTNLCGNAIKFSPKGKVSISARWRNPMLELQISDQGPGIAPELAEQVFEPFQRAPEQERTPGSGLGLHVSRELALAMGGELQLESQPGQGCRFTLQLPCEIPEATHDRSAARPAHAGVILVAEDDPDIQALLDLQLAEAGYPVRFVDTGPQLLEQATAPDVMLCLVDNNLPEMTGEEALARLRADGFKRPVIAMTAEPGGLGSTRMDADAVLQKPLDFTLLQKTLHQLLGSSQHDQPAG